MAQARPHVCLARKVLGEGRVQIEGLQYRCLVYVKTGTTRHVKDFADKCKRLGIVAEIVQDFGGYKTAYDCVGTEAALAYLTERDFVHSWHYVVSATVGRCAAGACKQEDTDRAKVRQQTAQRQKAEQAARVSPFIM